MSESREGQRVFWEQRNLPVVSYIYLLKPSCVQFPRSMLFIKTSGVWMANFHLRHYSIGPSLFRGC